MPVIHGEVKEKVYSVIADSIDVLRLYQSAARQVEAQSVEIAILEDRCDVLERSFGDTAALEHTISELQERNDALRLKLDVQQARNEYRDAFAYTVSYIRNAASQGNFCSIAGLKQWLGAAHVDVEVPAPCQAQSELTDDGWPIAEKAKTEAELERYKAAVVALRDAVNRYVTTETFVTIQSKAIEYLKEVGYDIEHEEGQEVPEIAAPVGSEDSTAGADEHDFL